MSYETAPASDRWNYPFRVAFAASWRLLLTISAVVVVPTGAVSLLLFSIGLSWSPPILILLAALWFAMSYFIHELGHAVALWFVAGRAQGAREMLGHGTFTRAGIRRWTLGVHADAFVSISGPVVDDARK